jgi:hypothetical protein
VRVSRAEQSRSWPSMGVSFLFSIESATYVRGRK